MQLIGEHWEGDVRVRWYGDPATEEVHVERWQDAEAALNHVAAANAAGVVTTDGLGAPIAEIPIGAAMEFCDKRGIPWEKFLYSNEYDDQYRVFLGEYQRLAYKRQRRHF